MNYAYLYIEEFEGKKAPDSYLSQLSTSVKSLRLHEKEKAAIVLYSVSPSEQLFEFCALNNIKLEPISLTRAYNNTIGAGKINVLVEKINILKNFPESEPVVFLDLDTKVLSPMGHLFESQDHAVMHAKEYPLIGTRRLETQLPLIPWGEIGIQFDNSYLMYNSGVVFIPNHDRKQLCTKALWICDQLNSGRFPPEGRFCNGLDEQIALSIVIHSVYGKQGKLHLAAPHIHHYWLENQKGIKWWD